VTGTDAHSTTYGAFNAFGTGVEGTDLATVLNGLAALCRLE